MVWDHERDTEAFAERLARALDALDRPGNAFIELRGNLGAGKTTFARHLLRALGVAGRIKSPTYAVVETYEVARRTGPLNVAHFDFYRFNDPDEWEEAGFRDLFAAPGLKLVEWAERAAGCLPPPDLLLDIRSQAAKDAQEAQESVDGPREVKLLAPTPRGAGLAAALLA